MELEFKEIITRKIVNVHKHVDGPWFWGKYTAHPYIGCRFGCEFCYARGGKYLGGRDPNTFDTVIRVKVNAVERLMKELPRLPREIITVGDWQQPAESRYALSRGMLEVVRILDFPLFIVERSPFLVRDLDLLCDINRQSWVGVVYSISSLDDKIKRIFEPRSPGVRQRLQAMSKLADKGITVGVSIMPVLPFISDSKDQLEQLIRAVKDHGGTCVMAGGLTMDGVQAERTLSAAGRYDPTLESRWRSFYGYDTEKQPSYSPTRAYCSHLGLLVREICTRHEILDRLPRYIAPTPQAVNKRIAELLFLKCYDAELNGADNYRIWSYRRAAWTVDEMKEDIAEIYKIGGVTALCALPAIGKSLAAEISRWLAELNMQEN